MPAPVFGNTEQDQNVQARQTGATPETDPNSSYGKFAATEAGKNWSFRNGQWGFTDPSTGVWKSAVDARKPGGDATLGHYVDGITSGDRGLDGRNTAQGAAKEAQAAAQAAANSQTDNITARMNAFITAMTGPMDPNDPIYKGLLQAGTDAAQRAGGRAGLAGRSGLGATNAASVAQQNVLPWMMARQQAGAQMLGQLNNRDISLGNLNQGQQHIDNGLAESRYNAQQNTNRTLGSLAGGVVGMTPIGAAIGGPVGGAALGGSLASLGGGGGPQYPGTTWRPGGSGNGNNGTGF